MVKTRSPILFLAIALLAAGVAGSLILIAFPTLLTGGYYEMTIDTISFDPRGIVNLEYHDRLAYGTVAHWTFPGDTGVTMATYDAWNGRKKPFLGWPTKTENQTLGFWLTSISERNWGMVDQPSLHRRLLLVAGNTYRVRIGEEFVYYRRLEPDGKIVETSFSATREP